MLVYVLMVFDKNSVYAQNHWFYNELNSHVFTYQKHMFFDMFTILFVTCFGIDVSWVLASSVAPCWQTFRYKIMFVRNRFFVCWWFVKLFVHWLLIEEDKLVYYSFSSFVRPFPWEGFWGTSQGSLWHSFGSISVVVVGTFLAPFWDPCQYWNP